MYCKRCKKDKPKELNFYKGFDVCKDCLSEYLNDFTKEQAFEKVKELLHENNYIINQELLNDIFFSEKDEYRGRNNIGRLSEYLKRINSLPQYKDYRYKVINEEKSDIEFINDDIKGVKEHIEYSLKQHNVNEHNKWLNSLRDAFLLRERLESTVKPTYDLYFDVERAGSESNCIIYYKGQVHNLRKFNSSYISEYINKLCEGDNVAIYGDINGLGRVIADSLYSLGYKINNTTINFKDSSINGGTTRQLECKYDR